MIHSERPHHEDIGMMLCTSSHEEYGIGWKVAHIPCNQVPASKLAMRDIPQDQPAGPSGVIWVPIGPLGAPVFHRRWEGAIELMFLFELFGVAVL